MSRTMIGVLMFGLTLGSWGEAAEPTLSEVQQGLKAREAAIRNFEVKADFRRKQRSRYSGEYLDSAASMTIFLDFESGRFRYQKIDQMYNAPGEEHDGQEYLSEIEEVMAFDGEKTRQLTWSVDEKHPAVAKNTQVGNVFPGAKEYWITDPRDFVSTYQGEPLSVHVGRGEAKVYREQELIVFEGTNTRDDGYEFRMRLWFDAKRGMIATRRETSIKNAGETSYTPYYVSRLDDLFEISPGIWLPGKYTEENHQVLPGKAPYLLWSRVVALSNWAINQDASDGRFRVAFPKGALVTDQGLGRTYRAKAVSDGSVAQFAKMGRDLRESFLESKADPLPPFATPFPTWLQVATALTLGLLAAAGAYAGWSSWRSKKRSMT